MRRAQAPTGAHFLSSASPIDLRAAHQLSSAPNTSTFAIT